MPTFTRRLEQALAQRKQQALYRQCKISTSPQAPYQWVDGQRLLTFCSNDYLGLANHPELIRALQQGAERYGCGSGAAHLINGHSQAHHELEQALAEFTGRSRALLFSTGYMANLGVISALLGRNDTVLQDRLNHASLLDAALLSRARLSRYRHGDCQHLAELLPTQAKTGACLIVTDGVFSMEGDVAPLPQLATLAQPHQAWLMVDDAHGFGLLGPQGQGSVAAAGLNQTQVPVLMATLGKALGTFGAFVAGSDLLIDSLIQSARPYIYTTAIPPAIACATLASLKLVAGAEGQQRRAQLQHNIDYWQQGATQLGLPLMPSPTAIQPLWIGDSAAALVLSQRLQQCGILISAIRPPTVPEGQARLRITLSAAHQRQDLDTLLDALASLLPRLL